MLGDVQISVLHLDFIPLEADVFSMCLSRSLPSHLFGDGDFSIVMDIARALVKLQSMHGLIPNLYGKGTYSRMIVDAMKRLQQGVVNEIVPEIDAMYVFDRSVDFVTPLMTQLTYEGLIDEMFGLRNGVVELPPEFVGPSQQAGSNQSTGSSSSALLQRRKTTLNSQEPLFSELRDANFSTIGHKLNVFARKMNEDYAERHQAKTVSQLKAFVGKLGTLQQQQASLKLHIGITELISKVCLDDEFHRTLETQQSLVAGGDNTSALDYLEGLIAQQVPFEKALRLLCLISQLSNIRTKAYEHVRAEILQTYGYQHLVTLDKLIKMNLLRVSQNPGPIAQKSNLATLRKQLRLVVDDIDERDHRDMSYVYSGGYTPMIPRIISMVQRARETPLEASKSTTAGKKVSIWSDVEDALRILPGELISESQELAPGIEASSRAHRSRKILVLFVGGCTYAEISALRYLSSSGECDAEFMIFTSDIYSGDALCRSIWSETDKDTADISGSAMR